MQAEQEKLANIIRAEGDSEVGRGVVRESGCGAVTSVAHSVVYSVTFPQAAELISSALSKHGRGLIELRRIEAARDIARTLSKSRNVAYLPSGNGLLLNMSV